MSAGSQRDRDRESRERMARRASSSPGRSPSTRAPRPAGRRRGVHWLLAVAIGVVMLAVGLIAGYASRGDRAPAELITVDTPVRVVTVTVESPAAPPAP